MGKEGKTPIRILEPTWREQSEPSPSHLSIVIAYFFYRCTAVRVTLSSSVLLAIAIRAAMYSGRSSGGSSDRTAPPRLAGIDHEVDPPPPSPTYGGYLDFAVSPAGARGPPAPPAQIQGGVSVDPVDTALAIQDGDF